MTFTEKTFTSDTILPALDLTHMDANDDHVRNETNYYHIINAQCIADYGNDMVIKIDTSLLSHTPITGLTGSAYDIDISGVSNGIHELRLANPADGVREYGPWTFFKTPDMEYLSLFMELKYAEGSTLSGFVVYVSIIGSRTLINP